MSTADHAAISGFLGTRVDRGDVPAVVAAVSNRNALLYVGAFGKCDVARNIDATTDTIFRIASMTKPVTSLAIMMLYDAEQIALDAPVTTYLPDYRQPPVLTRFTGADLTCDSRPARRPLTIRDLLTHTSGVGYPFLAPVLARLSTAGTRDRDLPLLHDPGARWTYGPNTAILGRVVARVSAGRTHPSSRLLRAPADEATGKALQPLDGCRPADAAAHTRAHSPRPPVPPVRAPTVARLRIVQRRVRLAEQAEDSQQRVLDEVFSVPDVAGELPAVREPTAAMRPLSSRPAPP